MFMILTLLGQSFLPVATVLADELGTESTEVVALSEENPDQVEGEALEFVVPESSEIIEETNDTSEILTEETDETVAPAESSAIDELNTSVGAVNMLVEDDEVDGRAEEASLKSALTSNKVLDDVFTFYSIKVGGFEDDKDQGIQDDKLDVPIIVEKDTQIGMEFKWDTNGKNAAPGDTASIRLPSVFDVDLINGASGEIHVGKDKNYVGDYTIENGILTITFAGNISIGDVQEGFIRFNFKFDETKFSSEVAQEIKLEDTKLTKIPVTMKPSVIPEALNKEGKAKPESLNATEITWTIDVVNTEGTPLKDTKVIDKLSLGLGEPSAFKITKLNVELEGNLSLNSEEYTGSKPVIDADKSGFTLSIDEIAPYTGYRIEYTTAITDFNEKIFKNTVKFQKGDGSPLSGDKGSSVTVERSRPIEKRHLISEDKKEITWIIEVNKNGQIIDNAKIKEELPTGLVLKEGSIEVYLNDSLTDIDTSQFPEITLGSIASDEVYKIEFTTEIDYTAVNEGSYQEINEFNNKVTLFEDDSKDGEIATDTATITRLPIIKKTGKQSNGTYDEDKIITWTVQINEAQQKLSNIQVIDMIPAGLSLVEDSVKVLKLDGTQYPPISVKSELNESKTKLTVGLGDLGTEQVILTYQTKIDDSALNENTFSNSVKLEGTGIGIGEGIKYNKDTYPVPVASNEFSKKAGEINYKEKTISWEIAVKPQRDAIKTGLEITA